MVDVRSDALALEGYSIAIVVDYLAIFPLIGMVFTFLLSFVSSQGYCARN
jgi:hypothetical protein